MFWTLCFIVGLPGVAPESAAPPRAARSVHLWWQGPEASVLAVEMTVRESTRGSYFMACGWNTGYFGIQELGDGRKVAIFSVWDPTRGNDPGAVPDAERVELLHKDEGVRIRRFGGEGTGGQCMLPFAWKIDQPTRFLVRAVVQDAKTAYAGYIFDPESSAWRHLVTFRTRTGGQPLRGLYSFVEDFRRDVRSATERRRAAFGSVWIRDTLGRWLAADQARFTASSASWEAKETINATVENRLFTLSTGGETKNTNPLNSMLEREAVDTPPPADIRAITETAADQK